MSMEGHCSEGEKSKLKSCELSSKGRINTCHGLADSSSGVSDQQSVDSSPSRDSCVLNQDT